jgi:hypothetical protein
MGKKFDFVGVPLDFFDYRRRADYRQTVAVAHYHFQEDLFQLIVFFWVDCAEFNTFEFSVDLFHRPFN